MAGMAGIEPANDGIKTRCLTTWRHPNYLMVIYQSLLPQNQNHFNGSSFIAINASFSFSKATKTHEPLPVILALINMSFS